jgi:lipid II:glycine glycyltransferase (peptidoglycan interpeptide bridge formation enzyme)
MKPVHELKANDFVNESIYSITVNYKRIELIRYNTPSIKGWLVSRFDTERKDYTGGSNGYINNFLTAKSLFIKLIEKEKEKLTYQF